MNLRTDKQLGEWIDRNKQVSFSFEGQQYTAFDGDTISSALWASGEKVLGRSFKYHRARGVMSLANHDINVMLTDGEDTNMRGDVLAVKEGMSLTAVNTIGGVRKDKNRFIEYLAPFLTVGFYYKAFYKPKFMFPFWERVIRNAAGLGITNFNYPRIPKPKLNKHVDVLVVGAGPSGLSAALSVAMNTALQVLIVDENHQAGGSFAYDRAGLDTQFFEMEELLAEVGKANNITLRLNAYASAYYTDHLIPIVEEGGITKVRAKTVIVATGAFEQPPVFRNNDLPGVVNGSAAQRLIYRFATKPFFNGVVFTANDYGYRVAKDLIKAGVEVSAIVDLRKNVSEKCLTSIDELKAQQIAIYNSYCVYEAVPNKDRTGVSAIVICPFNEDTNEADASQQITLACDGVAMSAGWAPAAALLYQSGMKVKYDYNIEQFVPDALSKGIFAAGKVNGSFELDQRITDGARAAVEAMRYLGEENGSNIKVEPHTDSSPSHFYPVVNHPKGRNFVDFDEDIQTKDFINAAKEGFDNIELMKRFTTVGMGPSQGKHSNMNAIRILARIRDLPVEKIGSTTSRPFFHPTPIGHLGGRSFHPQRQSAIQGWHKKSGAVLVDVGAWRRPEYYQVSGLTVDEIVQQEAEAVFKKVGIIDGSSLGKIEVCGPDAAAFLERFFTGKFIDQKMGETRYALSLDESAVISDDGLASRINDELFYITVGTGNTAIVYREMQRWLQIWQLDAVLINVTGSYGIINVVGPAAKEVLKEVISEDISNEQFPLSSVKQFTIEELSIRVMRVAFVAEQGYELHVPADSMLAVWEMIIKEGQPFGMRPFGTATQRLLRLEMGHHLPGYDTDGLTTPLELGITSALELNKAFFIGKRSFEIISKKSLRQRSVAFVLDESFSGEIPKDCNLVISGNDIKGRVTSVLYSKNIGRVIGFAYVEPDNSHIDSTFSIRTDNGSLVQATVVDTPFIPQDKGQ
jgi:sarcosine oxidase subunit alpha